MNEYPKIMSLYKRYPEGHEHAHKFIEGDWASPEMEYLSDLDWQWTEKIDGMNIRVMLKEDPVFHGEGYRGKPSVMTLGGKTDRAQLPADLVAHLYSLFSVEKLISVFPIQKSEGADICLYGEGYGAGIQKGKRYGDTKKFILFDIKVGHWWLREEDTRDLACQLGIDHVPFIISGEPRGIGNMVKCGIPSEFGDFPMEGLVGRPLVGLSTRSGQRVGVKIKTKDFVENDIKRLRDECPDPRTQGRV